MGGGGGQWGRGGREEELIDDIYLACFLLEVLKLARVFFFFNRDVQPGKKLSNFLISIVEQINYFWLSFFYYKILRRVV